MVFKLIPGMCRKLGPKCGYPQFRVIFAQKLGWCWVVGVNLPKLGSNYPNFTPISPPNCGKIGVKLVLWLGLGVVLHILIGLGLWLGVSKPHFAHPCTVYIIVGYLWFAMFSHCYISAPPKLLKEYSRKNYRKLSGERVP